VPTPAVTDEGVPLQAWDAYGPMSFLVKRSPTTEPDFPTTADVQKIIAKGNFVARSEDLKTLLLGDREVFANGFDRLLMSLALVPAGSVKTLNIFANCMSTVSLDFISDVVFSAEGDLREHAPVAGERPLQNVTLNEAIALLASPEISVTGTAVKLADVRRAFPVDGEVRIFNMFNPLREDFLQALANVFQVRTSGFARKPVRVTATVIAEAEGEDALDTAVLGKKLTVGFLGDPVPFEVDFFAHLLQQDRAQTGLFTAFPRR
jgi:hypothetical protein